MGLLDSVIGALGQAQGGHAGGGAGQADMLQAVIAMLGQGGGLSGLVDQFQRGGLGDVVGSWVGSGQNLPISPGQLGSVLGNDTIGALARQLGLQPDAALGHLSQMLPQVVDHLTPQGQLPDGGDLGAMAGMGDLNSLLGGMLKR